MFELDIRWTQLLVIALANFILSWLWYSPILFAKPWMKALGIKPDHVMTQEQKREMPLLFGSAIVTSLIFSFALQFLCSKLGADDFVHGASIGILLWLGFTLTGSLGTLWEGRSKVVLLINNGLFAFSYALFGGILGIWH